MDNILIVEDGTEYLEFFRLFLKGEHEYLHAKSCAEAMAHLEGEEVRAVVMDMRFDRTPPEDLIGDVEEVAGTYFGGDVDRAQRYVHDNQGTLILARMRETCREQPVLFVTDMPGRKLDNLRRLYGRIHAVPTFDAAAIRAELDAAFDEDEA